MYSFNMIEEHSNEAMEGVTEPIVYNNCRQPFIIILSRMNETPDLKSIEEYY